MKFSNTWEHKACMLALALVASASAPTRAMGEHDVNFYYYGYIDRTGKAAVCELRARDGVDPFDESKDFHNGKALRLDCQGKLFFDHAISSNTLTPGGTKAADYLPSRYFYIDKNASSFMGPYSWGCPFSEGIAAVCPMPKPGEDQYLSFIDVNGRIVGRSDLHTNTRSYGAGAIFQIGSMHNGRIYAYENSDRTAHKTLWGYLDRTGKWAIKPQFARVKDFSDGHAAVGTMAKRIDDDGLEREYIEWSYIDTAGRSVGNTDISKPELSAAATFSDRLERVRDNSGKYGFIDHSGQMVIPPTFEEVGSFSEGLAPVRVGELWGYIGKNGQIAIEPQYLKVRPFSEGRAAVVTRKVNRYTLHRNIQASILELVDSETKEFVLTCLLIRLPNGRRVIIAPTQAVGSRPYPKEAPPIVSVAGYAGINGNSGGAREVWLHSQPGPSNDRPPKYERTNFGRLKIIKLKTKAEVSGQEITVLEPPAGLVATGIALTSDTLAVSKTHQANIAGQVLLHCGIGGFPSYIIGMGNGTFAFKITSGWLSQKPHGGEAVLTSDGELAGMAVDFSNQQSYSCLSATTLWQQLQDLSP